MTDIKEAIKNLKRRINNRIDSTKEMSQHAKDHPVDGTHPQLQALLAGNIGGMEIAIEEIEITERELGFC